LTTNSERTSKIREGCIWAYQKETKKKTISGIYFPVFENVPEKLKKNTVAHSIPDVTPRKKSSIRPGYFMQGLPIFKKR